MWSQDGRPRSKVIFSTPFYQVSRLFGNLFSWKIYITRNLVWLCRSIFEILKLIPVLWRNIFVYIFIENSSKKCKKSHRRQKLTYKLRTGLKLTFKIALHCSSRVTISASHFIGQLASRYGNRVHWRKPNINPPNPEPKRSAGLSESAKLNSSTNFNVKFWCRHTPF